MKLKAYFIAGVAFFLGLSLGLLLSSDSEVLQGLKSAVIIYPPPSINLSANPATVPSGSSTTVFWSTKNAVTCKEATYGIVALQGSVVTEKLYAPLNLKLTCIGRDGTSASRNITISVTPPIPAPTINLSANPAVVASGSSTTVTWSTTNAVSCTEATYGSVATQGSVVSDKLYAPVTLRLTCTGKDGSIVTKSLYIPVTSTTPASAPTISLSANPATVPSGSSTTVTWSTTNAVSCSEATYGNEPLQGSVVTDKLYSQLTLILTCIGKDGSSVSRLLIVPVTSTPAAAPTINLYATPSTVISGSSTTVTWSTTNAVSCTEATYGSVATQGSVVTDKLYSQLNLLLTCIGKDGSSTSKTLYIPVVQP